jgi:hypothetical protein
MSELRTRSRQWGDSTGKLSLPTSKPEYLAMSKHEFYADPTLFDQWQSTACNWLGDKGDKVCPYAWVISFAVLGAVLLFISMVLIGISLQDAAAYVAPTWNQSLARGVTSVVALATSQWLLRQSLSAWPGDVALPRQLINAAGYVGWRPAPRLTRSEPPVPEQAPQGAPASLDREALQAFFAGVRAAGVNVAIAKALFAAGIRSPQRLRAARDSELVAIRGVGPATVRKLRAQFR